VKLKQCKLLILFSDLICVSNMCSFIPFMFYAYIIVLYVVLLFFYTALIVCAHAAFYGVINDNNNNRPNHWILIHKVCYTLHAIYGRVCMERRYEHLTRLLTKILEERPPNAVDVFEDLSRKVRETRFVSGADNLLDRHEKSSENQLAETQLSLFTVTSPLLVVSK